MCRVACGSSNSFSSGPNASGIAPHLALSASAEALAHTAAVSPLVPKQHRLPRACGGGQSQWGADQASFHSQRARSARRQSPSSRSVRPRPLCLPRRPCLPSIAAQNETPTFQQGWGALPRHVVWCGVWCGVVCEGHRPVERR
jgi:hypothetical protein